MNANNESPVLYDLSINSVSQACDVDGDGDIDSVDLGLIRSGIGQTALANDKRDGNGDGVIDMRDVRVCTFKCTRAGCAVR